MYKSIQQFFEKDINKLEDLSTELFRNPEKMAEFVYGVRNVTVQMACSFIGDTFEDIDQMIRVSNRRKCQYEIVRKDERTILTSLGNVTFKKTLFKDKRTGERLYLLDRYLGLEKNARMTEDAEAEMLKEAEETSYRKGGMAASIMDSVSKGTVKNKLHNLQFPEPVIPEIKKKIKRLYIDADEDHVALQFFNEKGDTKSEENRGKRNTAQMKLVYVYEGIEPEAPRSNRYRLISPYYFSGHYEGSKGNARLWEEIADYIDNNYDVEYIETIYLNADGGGWIKEGKGKIKGIVAVLDEYHINKYIKKITGHLGDSKEDGFDLLRQTINRGTKEQFNEKVDVVLSYTENEAERKRVEEGRRYITGNWTAAKIRMKKREGVIGSSTEGHVSHILASRMSSRPLGWSIRGADIMARLRAYAYNGGSMLELVRYQREEKKAVGAEDVAISASDIQIWENQNRIKNGVSGAYHDWLQHTVPDSIKKTFLIRERLNEL